MVFCVYSRRQKLTKEQIAHIFGVHCNTVSKIATQLKNNPYLTNDDLREKQREPKKRVLE